MHTDTASFDIKSRLPGVAATIALHLVILALWSLQRAAHKEADAAAQTLQWVDVKPPAQRPATPPRQVAAPAQQQPKPAVARTVKTAPVAPMTEAPAAAAPAVPASVGEPVASGPPANAAPERSVDDIMQQARRDIGKISTDLKKEYPVRGIRAPIDTAQKRLVKGIELAYELAPTKWYEPAKVTEIIDPGGQGRRRYRIITSKGPMCWTVDGPNTPNGRDQAKGAGPPKMTNCPPDEEPAKAQQW